MPRLDERLKTVARHIRSPVHADIGSDHGHLLKALLASGRIEKGIAIENKETPLKNSQATLARLNAEVRFADGVEGLTEGEAESLSICGMGGESIVDILSAHPRRVPPNVICQPNRRTELVRQWAYDSGYHLVSEQIVSGKRYFDVLCFRFADDVPDPVYERLAQDRDDLECAILFGPHHLRRCDADFLSRMKSDALYLARLPKLSSRSAVRLDAIHRVLQRGSK